MTPIEVLIAIQARSNSTRFPKKIYEYIGEKRALDHVIDCAKSASEHLTKYSNTISIRSQVAVLHPEGDAELVLAFGGRGALFISGPEQDVLSRFVKAQEMTACDYIVRLTSDCPLMLDFIISKHVQMAVRRRHDYVSNVDEQCRTVADGFDCEVLSKRAIKWLDRNARTAPDREHVTPAIRRLRPQELSQAIIPSKHDTSSMKLSLDTAEDLQNIRAYYEQRVHKMGIAKKLFGESVYEL